MGTNLWHPVARGILFSIVFSGLALLVSAIEPFGIDSAMDQHSRNILYRAFASTYGAAHTVDDGFLLQAPDKTTPGRELDLWHLPQPVPATAPGKPPPAKVGQDQIVTIYLSEVVLNAMGRVFEDFIDTETDPSGLNGAWQTWRPTYRDHAFLIHELVTLQQGRTNRDGESIRPPPAIFFDFIFLENGGTSQERKNYADFISEISEATRYEDWKSLPATRCGTALLKVACIKEAGGIPLVFARSVEIEPLVDGEEPSPAQLDLDRVSILAPVRFLVEEGMYPTFTTALSRAERQQYFRKHASQAEPRPTPAVVLYLSWCIDNPGQCRDIDRDENESDRAFKMAVRLQAILKHGRDDRNDGDNIALVWGSSVPRYFADVETFVTGKTPILAPLPLLGRSLDELAPVDPVGKVAQDSQGVSNLVCYIDPNPVVLLGRLMFNRSAGTELQSYKSLVQTCPYHLEVPFYTIGEGSVSDAMARAVFDGRVMIVGARFRNSADWAPSPAHGLLPGMHQHAMALDNLITDHQNYLKGPDGEQVLGLGLGRIDMADLYETFVTFLVVLAGVLGQFTMNRSLIDKARAQETNTTARRRPSHWLFYLMTFGTILIIVCGALYFQVFVLRMAPLNWIGLLILSWSFFIFIMRDEIGDDIARLLRRTPVIRQPGSAFLDFMARTSRYLDMETIGFERTETPLTAQAEKDRIVGVLYPRHAVSDSIPPPPLPQTEGEST